MRTKIVALWAAAVSLMVTAPAYLFAACGQAFCPIETSSIVENPLGSGQLYVNFVYEYIDQDRPFIGTSRARVGERPRAHDEVSTHNSTYKLTLDYGITPRFTLGITLPLLDRLHRHVAHEEHGHEAEEHHEADGGEEETEEVQVPRTLALLCVWRHAGLRALSAPPGGDAL